MRHALTVLVALVLIRGARWNRGRARWSAPFTMTMGSWLTIDPVTERFTAGTGYEKANAMLTRDYRAPYVVPASAAQI